MKQLCISFILLFLVHSGLSQAELHPNLENFKNELSLIQKNWNLFLEKDSSHHIILEIAKKDVNVLKKRFSRAEKQLYKYKKILVDNEADTTYHENVIDFIEEHWGHAQDDMINLKDDFNSYIDSSNEKDYNSALYHNSKMLDRITTILNYLNK